VGREVRVRAFGDLEAAIMDRLWERSSPATVRELLGDLRPERDLAYNTVLTVVDNLFKKGWLHRQRHGRAFRYTPTVSRQEYGARRMRDALDGAGDPAETLVAFVGQMSAAETAALRAALEAHQGKTSGR
jgi:predicted transcriptional regulator